MNIPFIGNAEAIGNRNRQLFPRNGEFLELAGG